MADEVPVPAIRRRLAAASGRRRWVGTTRDTVAGLSVALVLVPQSLAYAQLAGLPAERGLYAAALAPIAAAALASSPYLQTGPTAMTSLLVLGTVGALAPTGGSEYVALAALLAVLVGAWRLLLGLVRGGPLAYLMSQPVLLGFTAGTAVLIIASQLPGALGVPADRGNPLAAAWQSLRNPESWSSAAIAFALATAVAMLLGRRISPLFPAILLAVLGAIVVSALTGYDEPTVGSVSVGFPVPTLDLGWGQAPTLLVGSLVIALIGFAEPAAIARRYAAADRHNWDPNREMVSQGMANLAAGFGGGYPVGGSFSRTALNRLAGARTRVSGLVTGLAVLAFLPVAGVLAPLPTAVLSAIVIVAVLPMVSMRALAAFWTYSRPQASVAALTFVVTLVLAPRVDLAVVAGIALAVLVHLWRELRVSVPSWTAGAELHLRPQGVLFFASTPPLEETFTRLLAAHPAAERLVVHCDGLGRIDLTGALALRTVLGDARAAGMDVQLVDVPDHARRILSRVLPGRVPSTARRRGS
jgi:sulfate permease, SulP family